MWAEVYRVARPHSRVPNELAPDGHVDALGAPMPEEAHALPTVNELCAAVERSNGVPSPFDSGSNTEQPGTTGKTPAPFERSNRIRKEEGLLPVDASPLRPTSTDGFMPLEG